MTPPNLKKRLFKKEYSAELLKIAFPMVHDLGILIALSTARRVYAWANKNISP